MRLYFDLRDHEHTIPDVTGVEVADLEEARRVASEVIRKLRQEDPAVARDWSGWRISVIDSAGTVVLSIDLDRTGL